MAYRIVEFQETPNPNALKALVDPSPAPDAPRSYRVPAQAAGDPLAAALFSVPGVTNVLIHDGWISVGKQPDAPWRTIREGVRRAVESVDGATA